MYTPLPQSVKPSYLITISYNLLFLTVVAITEPVTTNTAATAVSTDSSSSMATATILTPTTESPEPVGTSTNTVPDLGVLSSSSTTPGTVVASPLNPDVNVAANQKTSKRTYNHSFIEVYRVDFYSYSCRKYWCNCRSTCCHHCCHSDNNRCIDCSINLQETQKLKEIW